MAQLIGTFFHSHGGTTSLPGDLWTELRTGRPVRDDVPIEAIMQPTSRKPIAPTRASGVLRERIRGTAARRTRRF